MKTYHICWLIGKDEQGLDLSTGKTYQANSPEEAIAKWRDEFGNVEMIYTQLK
jgi:hypothetical protein